VGGTLKPARRRLDKRVPRARRLRRDMTAAERKLWWKLRELAADGSHFRRQATIGPYFADFACHTNRLVVEIDGGHHNYGTQSKRDQKRDAYMKQNGYRVLRFWNNDVRENIEGVLTVIWQAIEDSSRRPPPLTPPHRKRGEGNGIASSTRIDHA
jgi:very-short-patch-repair endonuclease